ncbi:hypothetical protein D3C78_1263900 [compost metagenome]
MAAGIICSSVVPSSLTRAASTMGLLPWVSFSWMDTDMARSGASWVSTLPARRCAASLRPWGVRTQSSHWSNSTMLENSRSGPLRSKASSAVTCSQPWPSLPISASGPSCTLSKNTSQKWLSPDRSWMGRTVTPGRLRSTITCDRPLCRSAASPEVRTSAIMYWQWWALVVQIFWPLSTKPCSLGTARVFTLARSEPELGSLMPMQKNTSPRQTRGI